MKMWVALIVVLTKEIVKIIMGYVWSFIVIN